MISKKHHFKDKLTLILHIGFWCLVFLWPLLSLNDISRVQYIINRNWLSTGSLFLVFYINYFAFVEGYYFTNKRKLFYLFNGLFIGLVFIIGQNILTLPAFNPSLNGVRLREVRSTTVASLQLILPMVLGVGMCVGLKLNKKWSENERVLQRIKQTQLDAEIKYLRYQIQPHFLFNTLNNIYALIDRSPNTAKTSIHSLSKMMRYLLHDSAGHKVPLAKEIDFLERYIDLMRLRVSSNLTVETHFPIINQPIQIAPLLLISFLENAFKHGVDAVQPSFIKIDVCIEKDHLQYCVVNSNFPQKEKPLHSGIGLENLKKRLELVYPNQFHLFHEVNSTVYTAKLTLKL